MKVAPPETLTLAKFSELERTRFRVQINPKETTELELVQVTPGGTVAQGSTSTAQYESFSLLFHGDQTRPFQQGTYLFEHPQVGRFEIFIVPIAVEQGMAQYQAVFNRLVDPA
jgi:hypothetical protein